MIWFISINIFLIWLFISYVSYREAKLELKLRHHEEVRERFYQELADPERIMDEMERGARLREMRDANRTTLPRDDAVGQNARVFRPKMRGKLPSRWNPPRV